MKMTNAHSLTVAELITANRDTLRKIKKGEKSLVWSPLKKGENEFKKETYLQDNAVLLISQIVEEASKSLKDGLTILEDAKDCFISYYSDEE
jgi:hypothetical protein